MALTGIVAAGAINTVRDWHNTLQIIGVYGPLLSTSFWLRQFNSPQVGSHCQRCLTGYTVCPQSVRAGASVQVQFGQCWLRCVLGAYLKTCGMLITCFFNPRQPVGL